MVYSVNTKRGRAYLHRRGNLFWFAKKINKDYAIDELPSGYEVAMSKTGTPYIKKS